MARLPCYFSKDPLKQDFLDIYLATLFGVRKFKNTSAIRVIFFLKMFKNESSFGKCKKKKKKTKLKKSNFFFLKFFKNYFFFLNWKKKKKKRKFQKKSFFFLDNCIWRYCNQLSLLRREYLLLAVNVLTNSPNILHITNTDFFKLNCFHRDQ